MLQCYCQGVHVVRDATFWMCWKPACSLMYLLSAVKFSPVFWPIKNTKICQVITYTLLFVTAEYCKLLSNYTTLKKFCLFLMENNHLLKILLQLSTLSALTFWPNVSYSFHVEVHCWINKNWQPYWKYNNLRNLAVYTWWPLVFFLMLFILRSKASFRCDSSNMISWPHSPQ